MATTRQLIFYISDLLKNLSDDSHINEEHIAFALGKYRAYLLKLLYDKEKYNNEPSQNSMVLCLDMEPTDMTNGTDVCGGVTMLRSVLTIPDYYGTPNVFPLHPVYGKFITVVSNVRFPYVHYNKWLLLFIYCCISDDKHLYMKAVDDDILALEQIKLSGVFKDYEEASKLQCSPDATLNCDPWDNEFPLLEDLLPQLIECVMKEIGGPQWRPADDANNASDDLSDLATWITRNLKNKTQKAIAGDE